MTKWIAVVVLACGLQGCGGAVDSTPEPEPVCYVGEAQGVIVNSVDESGQAKKWCCTITCFAMPSDGQ